MIRDEHMEIGYDRLPGLSGQLEELLAGHAGKPVYCICVVAGNNVRFVAAIRYLLDYRINFYLAPRDIPVVSIPGFCDKVLRLETRWELSDNAAFTGPAPDIPPVSGAVFFSSSGTTGAPKYIYYTGEHLQKNAAKCIGRFGLHRGSGMLIPVPVNHMYGFGAGLLPALLARVDICLVGKSNVIKLYDMLQKFRSDLTLLTPSFCKMLLLLNKALPGSGRYLVAGDRISDEVRRHFESNYGPLINLYGCTELGAIATTMEGEVYMRPLEGVEMRIDADQLICRHDAAFERYVDRAGCPDHNGRLDRVTGWFRTGDRGVAGPRGGFTILGRMDHYVNRNGFLVSLPEIEAILEDLFDGIGRVILVKGEEETMMGVSLVAVAELKQGYRLEDETVRRACKEKLSGFMIPDEFVFIDSIPELANGKPDRVSLQKMISTKNKS